MNELKNMGNRGEDIAIEYLEKKGYKIICRNWHYLHREIDIIAEKNDQIIFIEVKTRNKKTLIQPYEAVGNKKQQLLIEAANLYIQRYNIEKEARFDIISILISNNSTEINHIPNAFYPKIKRY